MILAGKLLSAKRSNGSFTPDGSTDRLDYDNMVYRVLEGDQVRKVKVKYSDPQPDCKPGDEVRFNVSCSENINLGYEGMAPASAAPLHKVG